MKIDKYGWIALAIYAYLMLFTFIGMVVKLSLLGNAPWYLLVAFSIVTVAAFLYLWRKYMT